MSTSLGKITFKDLCTKVVYQEPFTLARYGDGEMRAIMGYDGGNCDGHQYFKDMGEELSRILLSKPDYYLGCHLESTDTDREAIEAWMKANNFEIEWNCCSGIFHEEIKLGNINNFVKSLEGRNVLLVGPQYLKGIVKSDFIEVPLVNCWNHSDNILTLLDGYHTLHQDDDIVVLFCASMAANVWIDKIHGMFHTIIDVGSGLDYHAKNPNRSFIRKRLEKDGE